MTGQPHRFTELMRVYEANFYLLRALIPDLGPAHQVARAPLDDLPALHLRVAERHRYTTIMHLTHYFRDGCRHLAAPDVSIRMYHDARLAEARSLRQSVPVVPPYKKWTHNRFLQKWLSYCLDQGYRFADAHTLMPWEVSGEVASP